MRVWLFKLGEQTPLDEGIPKLSRTAMLAEEFSSHGHEVVWWMATYDHLTKTQRSAKDITATAAPSYEIRMLKTPGYKKNVSIQRLIDHRVFDYRLEQEIKKSIAPDVIIAAYPTIGACKVLTKYATNMNIPIFIDTRDMWPDVFREYIPKSLKWLYPLLFRTQINSAKYIFGHASGVVGITDEFTEWALTYTSRERKISDYVAALAYNESHIPAKNIQKSVEFWMNQGISNEDQVICFFGVHSKKIDLNAVAKAVPSLFERYPRLKLVLCGQGDETPYIQSLFNGNKNVIFPGWVDKAQIHTLMKISTFGLAPYVAERPDFLMSMPTKIIEYMSGALPVLTSLKGVSFRILEKNQCGWFFNDCSSFSNVVSALLDAPDKLLETRAKARNLYEQNYRGEVVYQGFRQHIEQCVLTKLSERH